jgi:hypothetical protein
MLTVSAMMLSSSTYAWFTMNKEVQVTGLQMKTKVGSNLLLSSDNLEATYKSDRLVFGRQALLEPVSSINGKTGSFFYTTDAKATGQKEHDATTAGFNYIAYNESTALANSATSDATAGKYKYDATFNGKYGIAAADQGSTDAFKTAYGYVDYVFYLKATGEEADQQLRLTQCDLNYTYDVASTVDVTETDPGDNAWRIAVFATDITSVGGTGNTGDVGKIDPANVTPTGANTSENAKAILKLADGDNWTTGKAVKDGTSVDTVTPAYTTAAVLDADIDAGVTKYYKVLVRVWLEGEDKSCNSATYAKLTAEWSLDLDFQLTSSTESGAGKTAVTAISKNAWPGVDTTLNPQTTEANSTPVEVVPA